MAEAKHLASSNPDAGLKNFDHCQYWKLGDTMRSC